jgi:hypothetical protein
MPKRVGLDPPSGRGLQADLVDDLLDPGGGDALGVGGDAQVGPAGAAWMHGAGVEQDPRPPAAARGSPRSACRGRCGPAGGRSRPSIMRIVIDLPAPLGPRKPVTVPGSTVKLTSSTARTEPYCLA